MKPTLKQSYLNVLEGLCDEFKSGNKAKAFEILCAIVGEILKELPDDGKAEH